MSSIKRSPIITCLTALSLLASMTLGILVGGNTKVQAKKGSDKQDKVSPGLRDKARRAKGAKANGDELVKVILQLDGSVSGSLRTLLNRSGVHMNTLYRNFNTYSGELPASVVEELENFGAGVAGDKLSRHYPHGRPRNHCWTYQPGTRRKNSDLPNGETILPQIGARCLGSTERFAGL